MIFLYDWEGFRILVFLSCKVSDSRVVFLVLIRGYLIESWCRRLVYKGYCRRGSFFIDLDICL